MFVWVHAIGTRALMFPEECRRPVLVALAYVFVTIPHKFQDVDQNFFLQLDELLFTCIVGLELLRSTTALFLRQLGRSIQG